MHYVKINDKEYPFRFGQRELQTVAQNFVGKAANNGKEIEYDDLGQKLAQSFDLFLLAFHTASVKGCRIHKRDKGEEIDPLSEIEIEDAIDDDPDLYITLMDAFNDSQTVKSVEGTKKKGKKKA